jgi:hypothetical protein
MVFFFILTPPTSLVHNFFFLFGSNWAIWTALNFHLKLYKSSGYFKGNRIICKEFLRGLKIIGYELFVWEFSVKTTHPTWGVVTFSPLVHFCWFFNGTDAPRGEHYLLFEHHKHWSPLAKTTSKPYLKCSDTGLPTLLIVAFKRA